MVGIPYRRQRKLETNQGALYGMRPDFIHNRIKEGTHISANSMPNKDCVSLLPKLVEISLYCKPPCAYINRGPAVARGIE
jgi:hypothetical protein